MENSANATELLTAKLQDAVRRLESYSREMFKKQDISPLQKTISLFKSLVSDKKREQIEILQAVDLISRKRLFIQKLKEGTPAERNLADALTKVIEAYNDTQDTQEKHKFAQNNKTVSKFFLKFESLTSCDLPKIDLPREKSLKFHYSGISSGRIHKSGASVQLSKQTTELFQMKALALLERYGIATNSEARNIVKNSPIITTMESGSATCFLAQHLVLFPGQAVVVMGSSELDSKTKTIHRLFPETFYISLESTHTGFPDPSQRSGWAWSNQLLPECPQRLDLLDSLSAFFERKKSVTADLLPHGRLQDRAKHLLKQKKIIFEMHQSELIELHREFALALLEESPALSKCSHSSIAIIQFYNSLYQQTKPMDVLIEAHQKMRDLFISRPHKALMDAIISHQGISYETAKNILQDALEGSHREVASHEGFLWKYVDTLGRILGGATNQIILQYLSEDLSYTPPTLSSFEQKIQAATYRQAEDFMHELQFEQNGDKQIDNEVLYQRIKGDILNDMAILKLNEPLELPASLATYYQLRCHSSFVV